jgi:hypothetical protein
LTYWLKPIGHARGPLPAAWFEEKPWVLRRTGFPRRPRVADGDRFVYYASVWKRIFAIVEVVGEPEETNPGERWPWTVAVDPLIRETAAFPRTRKLARGSRSFRTTRRRSRRSASPRARPASSRISAYLRSITLARWM